MLGSEPIVGESNQDRPLAGRAIKEYLKSSKDLLEGKYAELKSLAPLHMTSACRPIVFHFADGMLVRFDRRDNPDLKVGVVLMQEESLSVWAPRLSDGFVHCPEQIEGFDPGDQIPSIELFATKTDGGIIEDTKRAISLVVVAPLDALRVAGSMGHDPLPSPPLSVRSEFNISLRGELMEVGEESGLPFVTDSQIRFPVGWEAIEIFPPYDARSWDPKFSALRAERDLLAAIAARNLRDSSFHSIDPRAAARRSWSKIFQQWEVLMSGAEEPLHQFLKKHPLLLSPLHSRMWSKLSLGKRDTDFVFKEGEGEYLLVELENPSHRLFGADDQPLQVLNHAIDQTMDWIRYLEDNLQYAQNELGLAGISSGPRRLVVIGRSASLSATGRRKLSLIERDRPRLKIMTYDDLFACSKMMIENLFGPILELGPGVEVYYPSH